MHTPIGKMQAGPADPRSSSDHAPCAISGKTRTTGRPRSLILASSLAFFNATFMPPPAGCIRASEERLTPDGRMLGVWVLCCWRPSFLVCVALSLLSPLLCPPVIRSVFRSVQIYFLFLLVLIF